MHVVSANTMPHNVKSGLKAVYFRYLNKPFNINRFMDVLDMALDF